MSDHSITVCGTRDPSPRCSDLDLEKDIARQDDKLEDEEKGIDIKGEISAKEASEDEVVWVHWDSAEDPNDPLNWSRRRKWSISLVGILFCALVSLSVSGYAISQPSVITDLHTTKELAILGITMFTMTFGAAPLILAPFSEVYGRNFIYFASSCVFTLFFIPQALAQNIETILVCRFISGIAGSTAVSLVGGTLADVWIGSERGLPMALFAFAAFASTGLGPVAFGFVEQIYGFRIISWIMLAMSGVFTLSLVFLLKETRASVLLSRKAARIRKETGDPRFQSRDDAERASVLVMLRTSLLRPITLLFTEPVLFSFAVWISFAWGVLYILLESIPLVYESTYGFSVGLSGIAFSAQIVGSVLGLIIDHFCDKQYHKHVAKRGPEARLYTAMCGAILMPLGCWIYAWTSFSYIHWIAPSIGITILYSGMYCIYLSCFSYLADSYTLYASSALSAQSFLRNLVGSVFPLFTNQLYAKLGVQGAGSLTAGIATVLAMTPFLMYRYGSVLRRKSRFAAELERRNIEHVLE